MKALIRFITTNAAGSVEEHDKQVDVPAITIGRATDQILHLKNRRARLQHARIEQKNGEFHITTSALAGITVNGRSQRDARLVVGDVIEVRDNILRVMDAPAHFDFAITFELSAQVKRSDLAADWSAPQPGLGKWGKRRLSWVLVLAIFGIGLVLPALGLLHPEVASVLRGSPLLPDDGLWLTGPVHSAHSSISVGCENCHATLFRRVPDSACQACHTVSRHVGETAFAILGENRCGSCHLEHNEPPQLVNRHQQLCADCHSDLAGDVEGQSATDFLDAHADFKISLLQPSVAAGGETEWAVQHVAMATSGTADRSNLKFDHAVHLDESGIVTPDGRQVIDCALCHRPEPGGARMQAISMDEHCSGCHALNFDPDDPSRTVPHGDPPAVVQALVEYYSARLLGADPDVVEQRLRRPGRTLSREDRDRAAAEARVQALAVAEDLFERRACANCHEVSRQDGDTGPAWQVQPVRLTASFFPHANFSHAAHDTDANSCDSCHGASTSASARDVLIPGIDTCRDCHGSGIARRNTTSQIPSTCIMCHSFHFEDKGTYQ